MIRLAALLTVVTATLATGVRPETLCSSSGCFEATLKGPHGQALKGHASYGTRDGRLVIVLTGGDVARVTVVITRDSSGVPAVGDKSELMSAACADDDGDSRVVKRTQYHVSVRGGSAIAPSWVAAATSGTLTLEPNGDGLLVGTLSLAACGVDVASDDAVNITLDGSFQAERMK
jgi:hypothetical protein